MWCWLTAVACGVLETLVRALTRLALTGLLGVVGMASLLAEPISWLIAGGAPSAFLAAADGPTLVTVALRAIHVVAVVGGISFMYSPTANGFFK